MSSQKMNLKMTDSIISLTFEGMKYNASELKDILICYKNNKHYVEMEDGSILSIDADTANLFNDLVEELGVTNISDEIKIPLYQAYFIASRYKDIIESNNLLDSFSNDLLEYKIMRRYLIRILMVF